MKHGDAIRSEHLRHSTARQRHSTARQRHSTAAAAARHGSGNSVAATQHGTEAAGNTGQKPRRVPSQTIGRGQSDVAFGAGTASTSLFILEDLFARSFMVKMSVWKDPADVFFVRYHMKFHDITGVFRARSVVLAVRL